VNEKKKKKKKKKKKRRDYKNINEDIKIHFDHQWITKQTSLNNKKPNH